jgi:hypothetical protein
MKIGKIAVFAVALLILGACGNSPGERALSGGGIGAGVGAAGAAVTGGSLLGGALLGGAAGAATGALTDEDDIDLGEPVWK